MVNVGDTAPDFELPATKGKTFRLSAGTGKKNVLLAFYPFDWSPVCTNEVGYLNTNLAAFKAWDVNVVAVSVDSPFSHQAWAKAEALKFPLLSDFNKEVCALYGVLCDEYSGLKSFAKRSVFIVDKSQTVRYKWVSDEPGEEPDYQEILCVCDDL